MMTVKQEKFVLARIHFYDERITALEARIQELCGYSVPERPSEDRVDAQLPENKD